MDTKNENSPKPEQKEEVPARTAPSPVPMGSIEGERARYAELNPDLVAGDYIPPPSAVRPSAAPGPAELDPDAPPMPTAAQIAGLGAGVDASARVPPSDEPGELGFIQAGYVYYDSKLVPEKRVYTYVEAIVGDGGIRNAMTRENHLKLRILGSAQDGSRDRKSTRHRRALAREVDTRVLHQDLEYPLAVTAHEQMEVMREARIPQNTQHGLLPPGYRPTPPGA